MSNRILELSRLIECPELLSAEVAQATGILQQSLQKNYVQRLHAATEEQKRMAREHPPKEVALLRAMKQFMPTNAKQLDAAIDSLLMLTAFQNMQQEVSAVRNRPRFGLRSAEDGEIEEAETTDATALLLALAFFDKL